MLVCSCMVVCFVIVLLYDLAQCNECSFNESQDEIPIDGGSLSQPKFPFWDVTGEH